MWREFPSWSSPGKNGWLVPAGSVPDLVTALEAVLAATPAQLAAMGDEGRVRVRAGHDSEKIGAPDRGHPAPFRT